MGNLPMGLIVETAVAILLALTLGYCVVLNARLKRLHEDRGALREMVTDLVGATNLANQAIKELKTTALDADLALTSRLDEAERFGIELANHVNAGTVLMERIARITSTARAASTPVAPPVVIASPETDKLQVALAQLASRERMRGTAA